MLFVSKKWLKLVESDNVDQTEIAELETLVLPMWRNDFGGCGWMWMALAIDDWLRFNKRPGLGQNPWPEHYPNRLDP